MSEAGFATCPVCSARTELKRSHRTVGVICSGCDRQFVHRPSGQTKATISKMHSETERQGIDYDAMLKAVAKNCFSQPTGTELKVIDDITKRQRLGIAKYGQTVAANPLSHRQWLQHAYEEALDMAVYLRRAIDELETSE